MESVGSRVSNETRRKALQKELRRVELSIYELELGYLQECVGGNAMRGWESETNDAETNSTKSEVPPEDMMFSKSSMSSPLYSKQSGRTILQSVRKSSS
jgi:hypothetical protein